ncbi:MAG: endolytic transglycosylase MltG [Burkholderiales bacterium]|nr:endolytic transglycosylase MltG [Burkholderiales bacterium]
MKKNRVVRFALFSLVALVAFAAAAWFALPHWPATIPQGGLNVSVRQGSGLARLAGDLQRLEVAPSLVVQAVARLRGSARKLRAGEYLFESPQTVADILAAIEAGNARQLAVTVVEGSRLADVYRLFSSADGSGDAAGATAAATFARGSLPTPTALSAALGSDLQLLEGYFFPDTYFVAPGSSATTLLKLMHKRMKDELARAWEQRAVDTPLKSPYEALILASIIEKETGRDSDRPLVGSVFVNRLRIGMRLQTDPTVIYGLGERFDGNLRKVDLQADTPYNTYTRNGLPPTPIALPGRASLRAAVAPPASEFLYFVARGDGTSEFSRNLAEHNRAVAKYQLGR